ncbi:hypothetical protein SCHPADRAFT_930901 [Schizopora paradoxa]|uniref:Uncharacterized protein n=1 Tax=Schizopora paradoxa TaxID=27342 RepID=A0A0H2RK58_9AGAM|nr:hypothetical protein SCHPADRAFT_930901 [Schizopora paradoxa]
MVSGSSRIMGGQPSEGVAVRLKFPLVPKRGKICSSDQEKAFEVDPLEQLPGFLLASGCEKLKKRPPTLHLGWPMDDSLLVRLCEERGIGPSEELEELPLLEDDGYALDSDNEEDMEPDLIHKMRAFFCRCDELQLNVCPDLVTICDPSTKKMGLAVAVLSNYNFWDGELDRKEWPKIMNEFGLEGKPKWYLDFNEWFWN